METKFTKGPWGIDFDHQDEIVVNAKDDSDGWMFRLALVLGQNSESERTEMSTANAHLIAAAPLMAEYIMRKADEGDEDAKSIIAKACP
ncbi:hypothetical protein [uncultured Methylophaga sp.]|uniref:hypothetical protein n=1 Tax=uncultured Methylophaga sp. TaxID=285271 RepID=UPI0030F8F5C1